MELFLVILLSLLLFFIYIKTGDKFLQETFLFIRLTYLGYNQNLLRDRKNLKNRFRDSLIKIKSNKITKALIINTHLMVKMNKINNKPYLNKDIVSIIEEVFPVNEYNYNIIIHPLNLSRLKS